MRYANVYFNNFYLCILPTKKQLYVLFYPFIKDDNQNGNLIISYYNGIRYENTVG